MKYLVFFSLYLFCVLPTPGSDRLAKLNEFGPEPSRQSRRESALAAVRRSDASVRDSKGNISPLPIEEHLKRAAIYFANRAFDEARMHWQAVLTNYPNDPRVAEAMLGIGRSYFQGKVYTEAYALFNRLARSYPNTKEGREGLNYSAASLLRLGRFSEAAATYAEYITRYPSGERIETAHLNVIDTLREANEPAEALRWVARTRERFAGTPTETNAIFALLRLQVAQSEWAGAINTADLLLRKPFQKGVQTSPSEVTYLKAFSLEQAGNKEAAFSTFSTIPDSAESYFGWLATQHLLKIEESTLKSVTRDRQKRVDNQILGTADTYPAPYRYTILKAAKRSHLDPRFILALIRQESVFRPTAKSPAGARGLLQLTIDAAQKYASAAGLTTVRENQLYEPETSIMVGAEYLRELTKMFPELPEAVAASYNGGEDNVARWVKRGNNNDPGVFVSEIGFDETKAYVQKVLANYRAYIRLYTPELNRK
ncbi:MAG: transglycosylase SLT domain-containing protein [Pyrinomonadaceae bacterium]